MRVPHRMFSGCDDQRLGARDALRQLSLVIGD
jgi:hypothetical protein